MERKELFDANVWIGYFATTDPHHKKAVKIFDELADDDVIYITNEIISEVTTVLSMRYGLEAAKTFVRFLLETNSIIRIPSNHYFDITLNYLLETDNSKLSFTDFTLVVLSEQFHVQTFDKALAKQLYS